LFKKREGFKTRQTRTQYHEDEIAGALAVMHEDRDLIVSRWVLDHSQESSLAALAGAYI
jgi:hypothetical protein